jgi:hypothetical protein
LSNFYKLIKYRKFLKKQFKHKTLDKQYLLICDFNHFNGLGLKLLKLFIIKNVIKFNLYKNLLANFYINLNFINANLIYFKFNKFNNIIKFIKFLKYFTILPFFCFPTLILNKFKNIILPVHITKLIKSFQFNQQFLIKKIFINLIKKLILNYIIKIIIKLKKCQH